MTTTGVGEILFVVVLMCLLLFFSISTPENIYLDKNIYILGGLEAEILTRVVCGLCQPFLKWPPLESVFFLVA